MIEETLCPECNAKMVSRVNKQSGQRFWGCSNFPNCKGTRDTDGNSRSDREKQTITSDDIGQLPSEVFFVGLDLGVERVERHGKKRKK